MITYQEAKDIFNSYAVLHGQMRLVRRYFEGKQQIAELSVKRKDGRDKSKVITNWVEYITRMHSGFVLSKPVSISSSNENALEEIREIYKRDELHTGDLTLLRNAILYGYGVEVHGYDNQGYTISVQRNSDEWVPVYNEYDRLVMAVRCYVLPKFTMYNGVLLKDNLEIMQVYDATSIGTWEDEIQKSITPHAFEGIPVVFYYSHEDRKSFFTDALLNQCDTYDICRSSMNDDIKFNVDRLLKITGGTASYASLLAEDKNGRKVVDILREMGILLLKNDQDAEYIAADVAVEKFESNLKTTRQSIHLMAALADFDEMIGGNDGTITNISGIALKLMLHAMIQQAGEFINHHSVGLEKRFNLWNGRPLETQSGQLDDFNISYTLNIPYNDVELIQYLPNLREVLSLRDRINLLPFVSDKEQAFRNKEEEVKNSTVIPEGIETQGGG